MGISQTRQSVPGTFSDSPQSPFSLQKGTVNSKRNEISPAVDHASLSHHIRRQALVIISRRALAPVVSRFAKPPSNLETRSGQLCKPGTDSTMRSCRYVIMTSNVKPPTTLRAFLHRVLSLAAAINSQPFHVSGKYRHEWPLFSNSRPSTGKKRLGLPMGDESARCPAIRSASINQICADQSHHYERRDMAVCNHSRRTKAAHGSDSYRVS